MKCYFVAESEAKRSKAKAAVANINLNKEKGLRIELIKSFDIPIASVSNPPGALQRSKGDASSLFFMIILKS